MSFHCAKAKQKFMTFRRTFNAFCCIWTTLFVICCSVAWTGVCFKVHVKFFVYRT